MGAAEKLELKPGWTTVRFGDVVRQVKDKVDPDTSGLERYIAGEHMDTDDLKIRRWGEIGADYLGPAFHMRFRSGQVLYGSRRTYLRKVAVPDFEGICANTTFVLESKSHKILLPELLPFIMQTDRFNKYSIEQSKGSVNPYVNFSDIANFEFALPPIEEQRRFTQILCSLESLHSACIETAESIEKLLMSRTEDFFNSLNSKLSTCKVENLLSEEPRNGVSPKTNDTNNGLRTVSISSISAGQFVPSGNIKYAQIERQRVEPFFVQKDDIFVIRGNGNRNLTAKCGISKESYQDLFYPDLLIRLRFDQLKIIPAFAVLQWNTPSVHRRLIAQAKSTNGIWKINGQDVRKHTLLVPTLALQEALLAEVQEIYKSLTDFRHRLKQVQQMKSFVLNCHISGLQ